MKEHFFREGSSIFSKKKDEAVVGEISQQENKEPEFHEDDWLRAEQEPGKLIIKRETEKAIIEGMVIISSRRDGSKIIERLITYKGKKATDEVPATYTFVIVEYPSGERVDFNKEFVPYDGVLVRESFISSCDYDFGISIDISDMRQQKSYGYEKDSEPGGRFFPYFRRKGFSYRNIAKRGGLFTILHELGHGKQGLPGEQEGIKQSLEVEEEAWMYALDKLYYFYRERGIYLEPEFQNPSIFSEYIESMVQAVFENMLQQARYLQKEINEEFGNKENYIVYVRQKCEEMKKMILQKWDSIFNLMRK